MYQTTHQDLLHRFEALHLDPAAFDHREHVRLAFLMLRRHGLTATLERLPRGLRRLSAHLGEPEKYHETVTWGLVLLIHERLAAEPEALEWEAFAERHPDLLRFRGGAFFDYWPTEILDDPLARRTFVLPRSRR